MANRNLKQVVIVGRPNVGKSTLFNRLSGRRRALIHDMPGMTRDRLTGIVALDDGRRYELTDTGGLEYGESPMSAFADEIRGQAQRALKDADFILFVVDGAAGLLAEDRDIAQDLRPEASKTVLIVNKTDRKDAEEAVHDFWALGFDRIFPMSAEHGEGVDVADEISEFGHGANPALEFAPQRITGFRPVSPFSFPVAKRTHGSKTPDTNKPPAL